MKLSFVIPAYNEEKYIGDCLSSILSLPDMPAYEVIVADNDSRDRTAAVVREKFPAVKIVRETKKGPAAARNAGARLARGEYLAFIDADCRLPQEWWLKVQQKFQQNAQVVAENGPYRYYDAGSLWERVSFFFINVIFIAAAEFLVRGVLRLGGPAFGGNIVVKREAFEAVHGFDSSYRFYGEDIDLLKRVMKVGAVRFNPRMWVYSSARRFEKEGQIKIWWVYFINTVWVVLFRRVWSKESRDIR